MITWPDVVVIAPGLSALSAEAQAVILADVEAEVLSPSWPADVIDRAKKHLAAHLAYSGGYLNDGAAPAASGAVVSESVGPISRTYAAPVSSTSDPGQYGSTKYGIEYWRLFMSFVSERIGLVA